MKNITHTPSIVFKAVLLIGLCLSGIHASADDKSAAQRATELTQSMNCELGLRAGQMTRVNAINLKASLKMDSLEVIGEHDLQTYKIGGQEVDRVRDIELRDVLTPRQFSRYERISRGNRRALRIAFKCRK